MGGAHLLKNPNSSSPLTPISLYPSSQDQFQWANPPLDLSLEFYTRDTCKKRNSEKQGELITHSMLSQSNGGHLFISSDEPFRFSEDGSQPFCSKFNSALQVVVRPLHYYIPFILTLSSFCGMTRPWAINKRSYPYKSMLNSLRSQFTYMRWHLPFGLCSSLRLLLLRDLILNQHSPET